MCDCMIKKLTKENELLKEELETLKSDIIKLYSDLISLEQINKIEISDDIEEI